MRKLIAFLICLMLLAAGCGSSDPPNPGIVDNQQTGIVETDNTDTETSQDILDDESLWEDEEEEPDSVPAVVIPPVSQPAPATVAPEPPPQVEQKTITVYVTRTGAKYHRDGCRYLSKSRIPMELGAAQASGYGACSVCGPPR